MHSADRYISVRFFLLLILLGLGGCAIRQEMTRDREEQAWIEQTLRQMTPAEKAGQMISSRAYGYYYSEDSDEFQRLRRLVEREKVGGFTFFQGDVVETASLINRLQQFSKVPLLISLDAEWGMAMRIHRATRFPEAMAIGATRDTAFARAAGEVTGRELRAIGVTQDFAPDADVNVNPENPVINTRSFGEDPQLVADMAWAFASGLQSSGVMATAKHFPGHGDTRVDSHLDLPVISHSRSRLDSIELVPFIRLIRNGVATVMIAHLEVPSIEGNQRLPATLSGRLVDGFLRKELGFDGLIVTDAMDMGAIVNNFGVDSSVIKAVQAGVDIVLIPSDETRAISALTGAIRSGLITEERLDRSVRKILAVKWEHGLFQRPVTDPVRIAGIVGSRNSLSLAKQIARASITVVKNDSVLPLARSRYTRILNIVTADAENYRTEINRSNVYYPNEPVGDYFTAMLRKRFPDVRTMHCDPSSDTLELHSILRQAESSDLIICPLFVRARSGSGSFGLPPELIRIVDSVTKMNKPTVLLAMGSPYILGAFPAARTALCAYSDAEFSTEAAVEALSGEIPVHGKLPVTIPGYAPYGTGLDMAQSVLRRDAPEIAGMMRDSLASIDSVVLSAIRDSAFPGAQLVVLRNGGIVCNRAYGRFDYSSSGRAVTGSTLYDLASITKVIVTTSSIMRLYDENKIGLDDPVVRYIPEFGNHGKERITVRNLLLHNGGLPAFKPLYLTARTPEEALDSVYQTGLVYTPGDSTVYSDFDFIILGKMVEKVSGTTLDRYFDSVFAKPLGMSQTMFRPPATITNMVAPTELDTVYRHRLIAGVVHDENAYALGGVSGHAGLFSTASDCAVFMQMIVNGGYYGGVQYLRPSTIALFTTRQNKTSSRALGWDTKTVGGYSTAGSLFSAKSFGHTGFTGTSLWADPENNIVVVFLSNRVYPTRANMKIARVRPALHDAVMRAIIFPGR